MDHNAVMPTLSMEQPWSATPRADWLAEAARLQPRLLHDRRDPIAHADVIADPTAWQGWRCASVHHAHPGNVTIPPGASVVLDWGTHIVGTLHATVVVGPVTVSAVVAELPAELIDTVAEFPPCFPITWQPGTMTLPSGPWQSARRQAFRWLRLTAGDQPVQLHDVHALAVSAVGAPPPSPVPLSPRAAAIDAACLLTLRNCLHDVFEDGPKRDRRLWLGDLRLQARLAYATWGCQDLVKRCLLLHAACTREDGMVPACVFLHPTPHHATEFIPDYALLFGDTVLDWLEAGGDAATATALLPVALRQLDLVLAWADADGVLRLPKGPWYFVDWCDALDRQGPLQAIACFAARRLARLCARLGYPVEEARCTAHAARLAAAARGHMWDDRQRLFMAAGSGQRAWATQAWMVLADVVTGADAADLLRRAARDADCLQAVSPYLVHHVLEAHLHVGLQAEAWALCDAVWGGMLDRGADTFWEVYDPSDPWRSPYKSHLFNSACHAWSCTPALFLRSGALVPPRVE